MPLFPAYAGTCKSDGKKENDVWKVTNDTIKIVGENKVFQVDSSSDESLEFKRARYDDVNKEIEQIEIIEDEESLRKNLKKKKDKKNKDKKHKSDKEHKKKKDKTKKSDHKNIQSTSTQKKIENTTSLPYTINTKPDNEILHFETFHHPPIYKCRFKDFNEESCLRLSTRYFSKPIPTMTIEHSINTNNTYNHLIDFIPIKYDIDEDDIGFNPSNKNEHISEVKREVFEKIKPTTDASNSNKNVEVINSINSAITTNTTNNNNNTTTNNTINNNTTTTTPKKDILERYKDYLNQLNKNNYNLQLWIEFVNFQEVKYDFDTKNIKKPLNRKELIADLKLTVINDAITKNKERFEVTEWREKNKKINYKKKPLFDELLMMKMKMMMEMGEDKEVVVDAWRDILAKWGGVTLWKSYLTYLRSHASTVMQVIEAYKECFVVFKKKKYNDDVMMDILSSLSDFLINSGYTELCTSIYQLLIDLNIDPPPLIQALSLEDKLEFLGAYWFSGVGGFGEEGWVSFREWVEKKGDVIGGKNNDEQDQEEEWSILAANQNNLPLFWNQLESFRSRRHFLSWRKTNINAAKVHDENIEESEKSNGNIETGIQESMCEDDSRDISFEDISPFLFIFTTNHFHLIFSFLILLLTNTTAWCSACYVCDVCGAVMFGQVCSRHVSLSLGFHTSSIIDHLSQLPSHPSIEQFKTSHAHFDLTHTNTLLENIFKFAINHFTNLQKQAFIHLFITYKTHFLSLTKTNRTERNKELKQTYKELLKDVSDDVTTWLRYACFEAGVGNYKQAKKVVINNLASADNQNSSNKYILMRYYYDFMAGIESSAYKALCSLGADDNGGVKEEKEAEVLMSEMNGVFSLVNARHKGPIMVDHFLADLSKHLYASLNDSTSPLPLHFCHLLSRLTFRTTHNINDVMTLYDDVITRINKKEGWEGGLRECMMRSVVFDRWVLLLGLKKRDDALNQSKTSINKESKLPKNNIAHEFSHVTLKILATVNQSDIQLFPQDPIIAYNFYHLTPSSNVIGLESDLNNDVMNVAYIMHLLQKLLVSQDSQAGIKNKLKNFLEKCLNKTNTATTNNTKTPQNTTTPTTTTPQTTERTILLYSMLYTLFHLIQDPSSVENAFYRSVQLQPFNKSLYMVCQRVDPTLLVTVTTVMMRRRMRVRTYLEELLLLSHAYQLLTTNQKKLSI